MSNPTLHPHLIVSDAAAAIEFYAKAFGATENERYTHPNGKIVHARLSLGDTVFTLKDEEPDAQDLAPTARGGSPVILSLRVDDAHAVGAAMEKAGATVIFPIDDHPYGRMGRLRDPFGHVWIISQDIGVASPEEIQRAVDAGA
ncbi:VOC family protein [Actinopolymorpha alba]|uniref:VOC family protein n=1 Tax=Actinopolymorpha alba TaxID=533267 RepID=UPI0003785C35|nr:VOC family protein [Actinopolymorpha alba]